MAYDLKAGFLCPYCGSTYFGSWSHKRADGTWVTLSCDCHDQYECGCRCRCSIKMEYDAEHNPVTEQDFIEAGWRQRATAEELAAGKERSRLFRERMREENPV